MPTIVPARWTEKGDPLFHLDEMQEMDARSKPPDELHPAEIAEANSAKDSGNALFKEGKWSEANQEYNRALRVFSERNGKGAEQRAVKATISSNKAEALLKLERWDDALKWANKAIELDETNGKARFRKARALTELDGEAELEEAAAELRRLKVANGGAASKVEQQLAQRVAQKREALRRAHAAGALSLIHI